MEVTLRRYTGHTQKNGAVSKVNSLLIPHHSFVYALYYYTYSHDPTLSAVGVTSTSDVRASAMVLTLVAEK